MSKCVNSLHEENSRLRNEIKKLKGSLREINASLVSKSPDISARSSKSPVLTAQQKEEKVSNLKKNLEKGLFSPAKMPIHKAINNLDTCKQGPNQGKKSAKGGEKDLENLVPREKNLKTNKNLDKPTPFSSHSNRPLKESSLASELENYSNLQEIRKTPELKMNDLPRPSDSFQGSESRFRPLKDSFESYYESEEENISKFGKCELSYIKYREEHDKGLRRRERKMAEEIENLRKENSFLKEKIKNFCSKPAAESQRSKSKLAITERGRSFSRNSQKSNVRRSCMSAISLRKKHCLKCDALLAKGFSTVHCVKHGKKSVKKIPLKG